MKQISLITIIVLINLTRVVSQTNDFGKMSDEQWKISKCDFDSSSKAVILFDIGETSIKGNENVKNFDSECALTIKFFVLAHTRHVRIKILNKKDSLSFSFSLRSIDKRKDNLNSFKCLSQWQENGVVSKNKITQKLLKKVIDEKDGYTLKLDLSDERAGSIIDIYYSIESTIFSELPLWNFSNDFPTIYSEINYCIPDFFEINKYSAILSNLSHESYNREVKYRVSYEVADGSNDKVYSYNDIYEKYSLRNILSSQKTNKSSILKLEVRTINFNTISSKQETWRKS